MNLVPLLLLSLVPAQAKMPPKPEMDLKLASESLTIRDYCLPSGMRISFEEDHSQPIVAVTNVIDRGSDVDPDGREGIAHLIEHLQFRVVHEAGKPNVWKQLDEMGALSNAFTDLDITTYMEVAPKEALPAILHIEGLRLMGGLDGVTQEMVTTEREVVRNELRFRSENNAYGALDSLNPKLFPASHPYDDGVIGSHASLSAITLEDVQGYVKTNYTPINSTILIIGDFKLEDTWSMVLDNMPVEILVKDPANAAAEFAAAQCPTRVNGPSVEPPLPVNQTLTMEKGDVKHPTLLLAWALPGGFRPEEPLMGMVGSMLTFSISSFLPETSKWSLIPTQRANCWVQPNELASEAVCVIELEEGEDAQKILKKAVNGLYQMWDIENRDWQKAYFGQSKAMQMASMLEWVEEVSSLFGTRTTATALFTHFTGDAAYFSRQIEWLNQMEAYDAAQFAQKYLTRDRYTALLVEPYKEGDIGRDADENVYTGHPREPVINSSIDLAKVDAAFIQSQTLSADLTHMRSFTLDSGLKVVMLPYGSPLIARTALMFKGGENMAPELGVAKAAWRLTDFLPEMPGLNLLLAPIYLVGNWDISNQNDIVRLGVSGSAGNLDGQLWLLRSLVENYGASTSDLKVYIEDTLNQLHRDREEPAFWAQELLTTRIFGTHPLGQVLDEGMVDRMKRLTGAELTAWNNRVYQPANGTLVVVGQVDMDQAEAQVRTYFNDWKVANTVAEPMPDPPAPPVPPARQIILLDDPQASQSDVTMSCLIAPATEQNLQARNMMRRVNDEILFSKLRETGGFTYGAYSWVSVFPGGSATLNMNSQVQNDQAAVTAQTFLDTAKQAQEGTFDPQFMPLLKLQAARNVVLGHQTTAQMLDTLASEAVGTYSWDAISQYGLRLAAVQVPDIQALMGPCVGHEVVTVVGPRSVVAPQFDKAGVAYEAYDWAGEADRRWQAYDPKSYAKEKKQKASASR